MDGVWRDGAGGILRAAGALGGKALGDIAVDVDHRLHRQFLQNGQRAVLHGPLAERDQLPF